MAAYDKIQNYPASLGEARPAGGISWATACTRAAWIASGIFSLARSGVVRVISAAIAPAFTAWAAANARCSKARGGKFSMLWSVSAA